MNSDPDRLPSHLPGSPVGGIGGIGGIGRCRYDSDDVRPPVIRVL